MRITVKSAGTGPKVNDMVQIFDEDGALWCASHVDLFSRELAIRLAGQEDITFELTEVPF